MKFRIKLLLMLLIAVVAVIPTYADEIDVIIPDEQTGVYSYTYVGNPDTTYIVLVIEGLYDKGTSPVITENSVLYYSPVTSDTDGNLEIQVNPKYHREATMFIGAGGLESPLVLCHLVPEEKYQMFTIELVDDEYIADGSGVDIIIEYIVKDYFGTETKLPDDVELKFENYAGDDMVFDNNNIIRVSSDVEQGTFSFYASRGENKVSESVSLVISRAADKATSLAVTLNDINVTRVDVDCKNDVESFVYNPEKVSIEAKLYNQFGEVMSDITYRFVSIKIDEDGKVCEPQTLYEGESNAYEFIFEEKVESGKAVEYEITIYAVYAENKFLKKTVNIAAEGSNVYTGKAEHLYLNYIKAKDYIESIDKGDIKISADGKDVLYTYKYVKQEAADAITAAAERTKAILVLISSGSSVSDSAIMEENQLLTYDITAFERQQKPGGIKPVESITFASSSVSIPIGKTSKNNITVLPTGITETVIYGSSDESVATVDENGVVKAISEGTATITAYNHGYNPDRTVSASYQVVAYKAITEMSFSVKDAELVAGEQMQTTLVTVPASGEHSDKVTYSSSDRKIATVDANGVIKAVKSGEVTITATSKNSVSANIKIKVHTPNAYSVNDRLAKPQGLVEIPVYAEYMNGVSEFEIKMTYNSAVMSFDSVTDGGILGGYEGVTVTQPGTAVAKWNIPENPERKTDPVAIFNLVIAENVAYDDYTVSFAFTGKTANGDTVTMEKKTYSVKVIVGEKDTYTVSVVASTGGSAAGGGEYKYGEQTTVRAYASSSYNFLDWYANSKTVSTDKEYTFNVTESIELRARFEKKSSGGGGSGGGTGGSYAGSAGGSYGGAAQQNQVSAVISSAPSGAVAYGTLISLYTATDDAAIYYTLDGSTPSASSGILYTGPIRITEPTTRISVIAVKGGMKGSNVSTFMYTLKQADPVVINLKENAAQIKYLDVVDVTVEPDRAATRYEVIRMLKIFNVSGGSTDITFTDVPTYNMELIEPYLKAGIINGYPDGTFGGDRGITRAELVKVLSIMLGLDASLTDTATVALSDIEGHWAQDYIKLFVAKGYIVGYPEGDFRPDNPVSRAEVVTILNRITAINKVSGIEQYFTDLTPEHWAYDEIMNVADI